MTTAGIFARRFDSIDTVVQLGVASGRAINVSFPEEVPEDADIGTVRDALRNNPLPIFLPDHRVRDGQGATPPQIAAALRRLENE